MSEDHEASSSSETRPIVRKRRARIACYQCKARRTKCDAAPPDACTTCLTSSLHCDWPPEGSIKKRGRKPSSHRDFSTVQPSIARHSSTSSHTWHPPSETGINPNLNPHLFDPVFSDPSTIPVNASIGQPNALPSETPTGGFLGAFTTMFTHGLSGETPQRDQPWLLSIQEFQDQLRSLDPSQLQPEVAAMVGAAPGQISTSPFDWAALLDPGGTPRFPGSNGTTFPVQPGFPLEQIGHHSPNGVRQEVQEGDGIVAKVRYTRLHGSSAIRPGYERSTLHVRPSPYPFIAAPKVPHETALITTLVDIFFDKFACQFPALRRNRANELLSGINQSHSPFLLYSIAAVSARFSNDPLVALPHLRPHQYGEVFRTRAMSLVGMMMTIPSYEIILAFLLLALAGLGGGASTETWMLLGLAIRMSQDMQLHKKPIMSLGKSDEALRAERLTFWSVIMTDYALCLLEGRPTSISASTITQDLPTEEDFTNDSNEANTPDEPPRHPFPFVAQIMLVVGPLIDSLNATDVSHAGSTENREKSLADVCSRVAEDYDDLHIDVTWNAANLQLHTKAGRGPIYLYLHIFSHAVQCLQEDVGLHREFEDFSMSGESKGARDLSGGLRAKRWLHSPRFIGDMLVLANLIDPKIYLSMPFMSQCFFLAGKAFALGRSTLRGEGGRLLTCCPEKRSRERLSSENTISPGEDREKYKNDVFKTLTNHNIGFFRQALATMANYWSGIRPMSEALQRCVDGEEDSGGDREGDRAYVAETSSTVSLAWVTSADLPVDVLDTAAPFAVNPANDARLADFWSMLVPTETDDGMNMIPNENS